VAARPDDEWILARVVAYDITLGVYTVVDEDDVSKSYDVAEAATHLLDTDRVAKGEPVFAVYPVRGAASGWGEEAFNRRFESACAKKKGTRL
jgi:hypothetical protein